ncbi:MAG: hypothetical protein Q7S89_00675 [bacterium]|nr:hypothetical protein [bacterium]
MMLTVHALAGLTLSRLAPESVPLSFSLALLSHFVLDSIPHGDSRVNSWKHIWRLFTVGFIDAACAVLVLAVFLVEPFLRFYSGPSECNGIYALCDFPIPFLPNVLVTIAAFIAALLPDFLEFVHKMILMRWKRDPLFGWFSRIHVFMHCLLRRRDVPILVGAGIQFCTFAFLVFAASRVW